MRKLLLFTLLFLFIYSYTLANPKIDPFLQGKMNSINNNEKISVIVSFSSHLSLNDFSDISYDTPKMERRRLVIERLIKYSENTQREVRSFLNSKKSTGIIDGYEILWIINRIALKADVQTINELAGNFSSVSYIIFDPEYPAEELLDYNAAKPPFISAAPLAIEPGITLMNADDVWLLGNKGIGSLVANADDGFWWKHPDLVKGIWQNLGEDANSNGKTINWASGTASVFDPGDVNGIDDDNNGKIDDLIGWDFTTNNYNITTASHGSATLGHVIGDGTGGTQTGVAPEAKCILMRNNSGYSQQISAVQYSVQMGADIMTSSLSWKWYMSPKPDYSAMRLATDMSMAAGMIHTNSTSNDGNNLTNAPIPLNIACLGNVPPPWLHPEQTKIGNVSGVIGVGNVVCGTDIISSSSPYGPATWGNWSLWGTYTYPIDSNHKDYPYSRVAPVEPDSMGLLKPDVSAPGENSISTYVSSGTGYATFGGTSSATPHTAGCLALMLSINPEMLPRDVSKVLELTAVEKGEPGKDPRYGSGRIDALAATTSPKFTLSGINGGSNMQINGTLASSDTARELAGLKIITDVNPQVGSLKMVKFNMNTSANSSHIISFDLYWDKNKDNLVSNGDIKLKSIPFNNSILVFDSLKFKFLDSSRTIILAARTTATASGSQTVSLGIPDTNNVTAYYTTKPFATNFPLGNPTSVSNNSGERLSYYITQNYPNPFNPVTLIKYSIADAGFVSIRLYDIIGREVAILVNGKKSAGVHQVEFDSRFYNNIPSGVYYYKIESGNFSDIKKMILIK